MRTTLPAAVLNETTRNTTATFPWSCHQKTSRTKPGCRGRGILQRNLPPRHWNEKLIQNIQGPRQSTTGSVPTQITTVSMVGFNDVSYRYVGKTFKFVRPPPSRQTKKVSTQMGANNQGSVNSSGSFEVPNRVRKPRLPASTPCPCP